MTTEIKIDKNIPPPKTDHRFKYPTDILKIGESFFAPDIKSPNLSLRLFRPKKFVTRTVTENNITGIRVWRVS